MALRDLIPWGREEASPSIRRGEHPLGTLHREMNRLFDDFLGGLEAAPGFGEGAMLTPSVDVEDTGDALKVTAELPGMTEDDIDLTLTDGALTLSGEKKREEKKTEGGYTHVERSYGSFRRSIPLPAGIDEEQADADFKNGVLTVTLPKREEAKRAAKKITVKKGV